MIRNICVLLTILSIASLQAQAPGGQRHRGRHGAGSQGRFGEIHGMIRDENGARLNGAQIVVNGFKLGAVTEHGHYHVTRVPVGEHEVTASMTGYLSLTRKVSVLPGVTAEVDFVLESTTIELNPMVITGTRTVKKRLESPVQVDVVPPENFDLESGANLVEGIRFTPGVRVENNCQNCNFTQLRMNGLEGPYTQVLVNGRASFSSLAGIYGLEQIPAAMVERLEVVKGGGSSLYGGSAVGGVVNIITRKPQVEKTSLGLRTGWIGGIPDRTLSLSSSVLNDNRGIGAFVFGQHRQRNPYDRNGDGFSELGLLKQNTFGGQFFYTPDERSELSIEAHALEEDRRGGNKITSTQPHESDLAEATTTRRLGGGVSFDHKVDARLDFSLYGSFAYTTRDSYYGAEQDPNAYGRTLNPLYLGGAQFNYRPNLDHILSFGFEGQSDKLQDRILAYDRQTDETYTTYGFFAQEDWAISPVLQTVLGLRLDKHSEIDDPIVSPRASLLLRASEFVSLRGTFSTGYRPPVVFDEDLHITQVGGEGMVIRNSPDLEEEKSYSFSGGLEYSRSVSGGYGVFFSAGGFYTTLEDAFFVDFVGESEGGLIHERINSGGARVYGMEAELNLALRDRAVLRTGWTVQRSLYDEVQDISESEDESILTDEFPRTPDIYGFIGAEVFVIPGHLDLDFDLQLTGPMNVLNAETNRYREDTPWFGVFDTRVTYTLGGGSHMKFFLHGHNLFDSYQDDLDVGVSRDAGYVYGPQRPRSFYTGIEAGF